MLPRVVGPPSRLLATPFAWQCHVYLVVPMNRFFCKTLPVFVIVAALGCGGDFGPNSDLPRSLTMAEQELVEADNRFAFKLFREIIAQENSGKNVFVSPLSIAMALGMTYNGARGATKDSMHAVLELEGMDIQEVNQAYRSLIDLLRDLDPKVEFRIANSIWYRLGLQVRQEFIDLNQQYFDAEVAGLDFNSPSAPQKINDWVDLNTNGRISKIVGDVIDPNTVMFLINAIYFNGDWTHQFDKERTAPSPFSRADGSTVTVPMMRHGEKIPFRYAYAEGVQIADLSYGDGAYRMTIMLPPNVHSVDSLLHTITRERWNSWIDRLDSVEAFVEMPKFTLEYDIVLNDVLKALGMRNAFEDADFSGITPGGLFISKVKHKTFVKVDEEGTEAAAATSVVLNDSGRLEVIVDRPFIFVLRERLSGTILFMGKIMDPTAT